MTFLQLCAALTLTSTTLVKTGQSKEPSIVCKQNAATKYNIAPLLAVLYITALNYTIMHCTEYYTKL